jgi:hypothetical protein
MDYRDEYQQVWTDEFERLKDERGARLRPTDAQLDFEARRIAESAVDRMINMDHERAGAG